MHAGKGPAIDRCMKGNNSGGKGSTLYIYYPRTLTFKWAIFGALKNIREYGDLFDDDDDVVVVVEAALKSTYNVDLE